MIPQNYHSPDDGAEIQGLTEVPESPSVRAAQGIAELLDRELPDSYRQEWTRLIAEAEEEQKLNAESAFIFRLGVEWMALPTARVKKVVSGVAPHSIPHRRGVLLGLISVQGELVVCVSLSRLLGIDPDARNAASTGAAEFCYIVATGEKGPIAFPIDETHGVHRYNEADLTEVPSTLAESTAIYTKSVLPWKGHSVGCLDDQMLFFAVNKNLS